MPGLKMADSAVLREKPVISLGNVPASEWTLPRILKIKISRDTKQPFRRNLNYYFLLTISRPPRGYVETKKLLHTLSNSRRRKSSGIGPDPESRRCKSISALFSS